MDVDQRRDAAIDRLLVRETLEEYLGALDKQDWQGIAACFTDDSVSHYNNQPQDLKGGKGVADFLHGMTEYDATSHGLSHVHVKIDGDKAVAHSVVIATMHHGKEGIGRVRVRAIDYLDELVRLGDAWRISKRVHRPTLQYDALSQSMILFSE